MHDETTHTVETPEGTMPTGAVLLDTLEQRRHCSTGIPHTCPGCHEPVHAVSLTSLVYAFDICDCDGVEYTHLVEVVWHRACFATAERAGEARTEPVGV